MIESYGMLLNYFCVDQSNHKNEIKVNNDLFPDGLTIKKIDNLSVLLKAEHGMKILFYPIKIQKLETACSNLAKEIADDRVIRGTSEVFKTN